MNNKERFEQYVKAGLLNTGADLKRIEHLIDMLISALYIPVKSDIVTQVDPQRLIDFDVDRSEPINWGDLKCVEVKKFDDGTYLATIDEASPGDCQTFCQYIQEFMKAYGWSVKVQTEW